MRIAWIFVYMMACSACAEPISDLARNVKAHSIGAITIQAAFAPAPITLDAASLYFTMWNEGDRPDTLMEVAVDLASSVSLHDQIASGGAVRMVPVASIEIPAHGSASLEPGGLHAMLHGLQDHYREGDSLVVTVEFAHAGVTTFFVPVISYAEVANRMSHGRSNLSER